jgi:hypothetical protein
LHEITGNETRIESQVPLPDCGSGARRCTQLMACCLFAAVDFTHCWAGGIGTAFVQTSLPSAFFTSLAPSCGERPNRITVNRQPSRSPSMLRPSSRFRNSSRPSASRMLAEKSTR